MVKISADTDISYNRVILLSNNFVVRCIFFPCQHFFFFMSSHFLELHNRILELHNFSLDLHNCILFVSAPPRNTFHSICLQFKWLSASTKVYTTNNTIAYTGFEPVSLCLYTTLYRFELIGFTK